jgi:hypothetical protein
MVVLYDLARRLVLVAYTFTIGLVPALRAGRVGVGPFSAAVVSDAKKGGVPYRDAANKRGSRQVYRLGWVLVAVQGVLMVSATLGAVTLRSAGYRRLAASAGLALVLVTVGWFVALVRDVRKLRVLQR